MAEPGSIELILGPMFSEKTTELISRVRRAAIADQAAVVVKYRGDTRYAAGDVVAAHGGARQATTAGTSREAPVRVVSAERLSEVELAAGEVVVGIDEGQFYPDLVPQSTAWADQGRRVIVAALDGDYARKPFGAVGELIPYCEQVEKRRGVCMACRRRDAAFTQRLRGGADLVVIGGSESYRCVCRACYK